MEGLIFPLISCAVDKTFIGLYNILKLNIVGNEGKSKYHINFKEIE
jgi:hypothetical protein